MRPPLALALPGGLAVAFLSAPLLGILTRAPWAELPARLTSPPVTQALGLSLAVSGWALLLSLALGVPLAWLLARVDFPGRTAVRALVMLPMVLPPTVAGVALLQGFGRRGLVGGALGLELSFTTAGAVLAAAFVSLPFLVISLEGAFRALHPRYEETAASLGASPLHTFRTVTVPMVLPGLTAGAALCWARALGEFGATITFAGSLPGTTRTLPLQVYLLLQEDPDSATAVSLLLLALATAVLVALRGRRLPSPARAAGPAGAPGPARRWLPVRRRWAPAHGGTAARTAVPAGTAPAGTAAPVADHVSRYGAATPTPARPPMHRPPTPPPEDRSPAPLTATVRGATHAALRVAPGETVAVVGPNGAGKTTLLRALLGLTPRATARPLTIGGHDLSRTPTHRRRIAWVPQDGALFPHLTALANTAYGLRAQGLPRPAARAAAQEWLDRLGVGRLAQHRPDRLSGGQAQRVALARALASRPRLLLLDEPLAALDQTARARVRRTLRAHLADFPGVCLLVTHDPVEAATLADRVLVLENGRTVQYAAPAELVRRPRSPWAARMLGHNAWPATSRAGALTLSGDRPATGPTAPDAVVGASADGTADASAGASADAPAITLAAAGPLPADGTPVLALVPPEAVSLYTAPPAPPGTGSPRTVLHGRVQEISALGSRLRVTVAVVRRGAAAPDMTLLAEITPTAAAELRLAEGTEVWASIKATAVTAVPL